MELQKTCEQIYFMTQKYMLQGAPL